LSAERRALAQRSLLKLQLKQVSPSELPDPRECWRTLVGPPDGHGYQVVWFVRFPDERGRRRFLGLTIQDASGIQHAYGHHDIAPELVPESHAVGEVHSVLLPGHPDVAQTGSRLLMLETDFVYGRRLAQRAQDQMIASGQLLPIEYRLMGPWLWEYRQSEDELDVERILPTEPSDSRKAGASLLQHPAFRGWFAEGERLLGPVTALLLQKSVVQSRGLTPDQTADLARHYYNTALLEQLRERLRAMSEWLARAGEWQAAALALATARDLESTAPDQHPFTLALVELGARMLVEQIISG
jgi:hypothetical protein